MQDITERLMVQELSRSEARRRECERMVGVGSWKFIPSTGLITYSTGFAHPMGLSPGEILALLTRVDAVGGQTEFLPHRRPGTRVRITLPPAGRVTG